MSTTSNQFPIVAAVQGADTILGPKRKWTAVNAEQERLLRDFNYYCSLLGKASVPEISTKASRKAEVLNAFLKANGFSTTLDPFKKREFGVVSVLDLFVQWQDPGRKVSIKKGRKNYPGARLADGVTFLRWRKNGAPIVALETKSDVSVYLMPHEGSVPDDELEALARQVATNTVFDLNTYGAVQFPMVDLVRDGDLSWLKGMHTLSRDGEQYEIAQAVQQTKLRINEIGARAQGAAAISAMGGGRPKEPKPDLIIDKPFLIWFDREELVRPLFVAHVTPEDWKAPADLETP